MSRVFALMRCLVFAVGFLECGVGGIGGVICGFGLCRMGIILWGTGGFSSLLFCRIGGEIRGVRFRLRSSLILKSIYDSITAFGEILLTVRGLTDCQKVAHRLLHSIGARSRSLA